MQTFNTFNELVIPDPLKKALSKLKFINPTPIQQQTIPHALLGKDILGTAQTGTGKTGAFCIPILSMIYGDPTKQALILAPTRELASQIHQVIRQMTKGSNIYGSLIVGGESFNRQVYELDKGVDYIVATPGRLNDHIEQGTVELGNFGYFVLDEVDRMLDMGFLPQIKRIIPKLPANRQTFLFSATFPKEIVNLANNLLKNPVRITVAPTEQMNSQLVQTTIKTTQEGKKTLLLTEVEKREGLILVFARTKMRTEGVARLLNQNGHSAITLHGGLRHGQRKNALERFKNRSYRIMVATDLAGRGIDVNDIQHVINFDIPETHEDYIHRIGRTARQGKKGEAVTFVENNDNYAQTIITGKKAHGGGGGGGPKPSSRRPQSRRPQQKRRRFNDRRQQRYAN
jgi:ATP-dependent RNA helicase RhlE